MFTLQLLQLSLYFSVLFFCRIAILIYALQRSSVFSQTILIINIYDAILSRDCLLMMYVFLRTNFLLTNIFMLLWCTSGHAYVFPLKNAFSSENLKFKLNFLWLENVNRIITAIIVQGLFWIFLLLMWLTGKELNCSNVLYCLFKNENSGLGWQWILRGISCGNLRNFSALFGNFPLNIICFV